MMPVMSQSSKVLIQDFDDNHLMIFHIQLCFASLVSKHSGEVIGKFNYLVSYQSWLNYQKLSIDIERVMNFRETQELIVAEPTKITMMKLYKDYDIYKDEYYIHEMQK